MRRTDPTPEPTPRDLEKAARLQLDHTPTGMQLLDALHLAEMRAAVRAHLAGEMPPTRKALAKSLGMTIDRFNDFMHGVEPTPEDWDRLANFCEGKPIPWVQPEEVAIGLLVRWAANAHIREGRRRVAAAVLDFYRAHRVTLLDRTLQVLGE